MIGFHIVHDTPDTAYRHYVCYCHCKHRQRADRQTGLYFFYVFRQAACHSDRKDTFLCFCILHIFFTPRALRS